MENDITKNTTRRFIVIGECLIEMRHVNGSQFTLGYSGDTFNVAKYVAFYGSTLQISVEFLTAMGDDPYSKLFIKLWQEHGIGVKHIPQLEGKLPGLCLRVKTKSGSSQSFCYRSESAAREIFSCPEILEHIPELAETDFVYLSSTSMAILDKVGGESLLEFLSKTHQHKSINFYASQDIKDLPLDQRRQSLDLVQRLLVHVDIALCQFDQEQTMFSDESPNRTLKRINGWGVSEIVLVVDDETCLLFDESSGKREIKLESIDRHISDHGVIEAFNAGYVIGRCQGHQPEKAIEFAQKLANIAKRVETNIIPDESLPKLES